MGTPSLSGDSRVREDDLMSVTMAWRDRENVREQKQQ